MLPLPASYPPPSPSAAALTRGNGEDLTYSHALRALGGTPRQARTQSELQCLRVFAAAAPPPPLPLTY